MRHIGMKLKPLYINITAEPITVAIGHQRGFKDVLNR